MTLAIGLDVFSGAIPGTGPPGVVFLLPDVAWWLLETALALGLFWHRIKPGRAGAAVWVAVVWLLLSAARFTPPVLALIVH